MTIVLREMTRDAADAILAGERPGGVRVADDYPTEFSAGVAQCVGVRHPHRARGLQADDHRDRARLPPAP